MPHLSNLRQTLIDLNLTGDLNRNSPESNRHAVREMLAGNQYWTFDAEHIAKIDLDYDAAIAIMARQLGMSVERFKSDEPPYINPGKTVDGLTLGLYRLEEVARRGGRILLASAHPGSLLGFYTVVARHLSDMGAHLCVPDEPVPAPENRWIDAVDGVLVLSDEGNLMHTHNGMGMKKVVVSLKPDIVIGDHGFAMAAINAGVHTVAIFDVDDPALAIMASVRPDDVVPVPMNDNQTNTRSSQAARALVGELAAHA